MPSVWKSFKGIQGLVCTMGGGKSALMTRDAVKELRAGDEVWGNAGYQVIAHGEDCAIAWKATKKTDAWKALDDRDPAKRRPDCECGPRSKTYVSLSEMLLAPPGTRIKLDEVGTFMNARNWTALPRSLMYRLTQARKDSLTLTYTAQHELQVDVALRRLTQIVHHIKRIGPVTMAAAYPPIDFRTAQDKPMDRRWRVLRSWFLDAYNTHARVWVPPETLDELMTETQRWVPLDDDLMSMLRDQIIDKREGAVSGVELGASLDDWLSRHDENGDPVPALDHQRGIVLDADGRPITDDRDLRAALMGEQNGHRSRVAPAHNGSGEYGRSAGGPPSVKASPGGPKSTTRRTRSNGQGKRTNGQGRRPKIAREDVPDFYFD